MLVLAPDPQAEHFLSLVSVLAPEPDDLVAVIHCFFDESYDDDVMCVSGYVFRASKVGPFCRAWQRMLDKYDDLPFFRMSACAHGNWPFDKLSDDERKQVARRAYKIIKDHVEYGIAASVLKADFFATIGENNFYIESPYELCAGQVITGIGRWEKINNRRRSAAFFFESGDPNEASAARLIRDFSNTALFKKHFTSTSYSFVKKEKSYPAQAGDVLAWHSLQDKKRSLQGRERRKDFAALVDGTKHHLTHIGGELLDSILLDLIVTVQEHVATGGIIPGTGK